MISVAYQIIEAIIISLVYYLEFGLEYEKKNKWAGRPHHLELNNFALITF